jgi:DNA repair protein RecO (recombination protein O)
MVEAMAFGCRRPRSPLAAGMQLFSYLVLQLAEGRRLDTVKQCQLK